MNYEQKCVADIAITFIYTHSGQIIILLILLNYHVKIFLFLIIFVWFHIQYGFTKGLSPLCYTLYIGRNTDVI